MAPAWLGLCLYLRLSGLPVFSASWGRNTAKACAASVAALADGDCVSHHASPHRSLSAALRPGVITSAPLHSPFVDLVGLQPQTQPSHLAA